ncbi:histidine phosphatase superfamily [Hypomontagnella monticulosa]|nr:histidine phosphatase superfamily [Hypomontagnella monticulosa]
MDSSILTDSSMDMNLDAPTIHIIRHAQGPHNVPPYHDIRDPYLTTLGLQQCMEVQRTYPEIIPCVDLLVSSPMKRCIETALLCFEPSISQKQGKHAIYLRDQLQEVGSKLFNTGSPWNELQSEFGAIISNRYLPNNNWFLDTNGQSLNEGEVVARADKARYDLFAWARHFAKRKKNSNMVVVSHADIIAYIVDDYVDFFENTEMRSYQFNNLNGDKPEDMKLIETHASRQRRGHIQGTVSMPTSTFYLDVFSTVPIHFNNLPVPAPTERLIFRPLTLLPADMEAYHLLRIQPEPMRDVVGSTQDIKLDKDVNETRSSFKDGLTKFLSFGIFLKNPDGSEGELIGEGGMGNYNIGTWPAPYYVLKTEHFGKGYATEFLSAFVQYWFSLPRSQQVLYVPVFSIDLKARASGQRHMMEILLATTTRENIASQKVLMKIGFQLCGVDRDGFLYHSPAEQQQARQVAKEKLQAYAQDVDKENQVPAPLKSKLVPTNKGLSSSKSILQGPPKMQFIPTNKGTLTSKNQPSGPPKKKWIPTDEELAAKKQ